MGTRPMFFRCVGRIFARAAPSPPGASACGVAISLWPRESRSCGREWSRSRSRLMDYGMIEPTVIGRFDTVVATQPRKVCIYWGRDRITNADLARRIDNYGARLQAAYGVRKGDRVGILLKNCPEFIVVLYAALKSAATVVPINTFLKAPEIQHIVDDCQIKCLITSPDFDETVSKLQRTVMVPLSAIEGNGDRKSVV